MRVHKGCMQAYYQPWHMLCITAQDKHQHGMQVTEAFVLLRDEHIWKPQKRQCVSSPPSQLHGKEPEF